MPLKNPRMVVYSKDAMSLLDLSDKELNVLKKNICFIFYSIIIILNLFKKKRKEAAEYLSGNKEIKGSETAAHCYCGHQFGVFAGQLGDGAAM
jgi:uncharacterized protein YdiU (UPF0061 family)